jgi:uncharacterized membrane protein YccC
MMLPNDLIFRLRKRAEIRRQITTRKSVKNNEPDRIADLLEEAANEIEALQEGVKKYEKHIAIQYLEELRQQADQLAKYKQVLESIANEYVELSHDKIKWQCDDHIRWAKEALK